MFDGLVVRGGGWLTIFFKDSRVCVYSLILCKFEGAPCRSAMPVNRLVIDLFLPHLLLGKPVCICVCACVLVCVCVGGGWLVTLGYGRQTESVLNPVTLALVFCSSRDHTERSYGTQQEKR